MRTKRATTKTVPYHCLDESGRMRVDDPENPSDYLTKFIGAEKTASSIAYSIGKHRRFARSDADADDVAREVREVPCDAAKAGGVCQQPGV